jgi:GNAT superfamily N-acetyltransferase
LSASLVNQPLADCVAQALAMRNASRGTLRDESYLRWRYLDRPGPAPAFVVWLREGAENLAAATVAPHEVHVDGQRVAIGIVGDISVAPAARGRGLAARLMEGVALESRSLDGVLVMPNPPLHGTLRKSGWHEMAGLVRFVRYVSAPQGATPRAVTQLLARGASSLLGASQALRRRSRLAAFRLEERSDLPSDYPEFWARAAAAAPLIGSRAPAYLHWRYFAHPLHRYRFFELREGAQLAGYAFARSDGEALWIDDWLALDVKNLDILGAKLLERERARGCVSIHTRAQARGVASIPWRNLGFLSRSDTQAVFVTGRWAARAESHARNSDGYFTPGDKDV